MVIMIAATVIATDTIKLHLNSHRGGEKEPRCRARLHSAPETVKDMVSRNNIGKELRGDIHHREADKCWHALQ